MVNDKNAATCHKYSEFESVFNRRFNIYKLLVTTHHLLSNGFGKLNGLSVRFLLNKKLIVRVTRRTFEYPIRFHYFSLGVCEPTTPLFFESMLHVAPPGA